ncbi:hypothetical protein XELAEV_180015961mg, partial [Xenopus laevis]
SKEVDSLIRKQNLNLIQMETNINEMATKLLLDFKQSLKGDDAKEKERLVNELESYLLEQQQEFCEDYSKRFYRFQNHKRMERMKKTFQNVLSSKSKEVYSLITEENVSPSQMKSSINDTATKFLEDFKQLIQGDDTQEKERLKSELELYLLKLQQKFCKDYSKRFCAFQNHKRMETIKELFQGVILSKSKEVDSLITEQNMSPSQMKSSINDTATKFLQDFKQSIQGDDTQEKERLENELKSHFLKQQQMFYKDYSKRFFAFQNHERMETITKLFQSVILSKTEEADNLITEQNVSPTLMEARLNDTTNNFLRNFEQSFQGDDAQEKERLVNELESYLLNQQQEFCNDYSQRFYRFQNHRRMEDIKEQFRNVILSKTEEADNLITEQNVSPTLMEASLNDIRNNFLRDFEQSFQGDDAQEKERLVNELESYLLNQQHEFCNDYSQRFYRFQNHRRMENIKEQFQNVIKSKESEICTLIRNNNYPNRIEREMLHVVNQLLDNYRESLEGIDDEQKELLVNEMESHLLQENELFCIEYSKNFYAFKNQKRMEDTKRRFLNFLEQKKEETSSSLLNKLMVMPSAMESQIQDSIKKYMDEFKRSLEGTDSQEKNHLVARLNSYLDNMKDEFCKEYSSIYTSAMQWITGGTATSFFLARNMIGNASLVAAAAEAPVLAAIIGGAVIVGALVAWGKTFYFAEHKKQ